VDLPCFPDVVIRIRNALADPKNTTERTVTIVGAEPRLTARLLQTANSAAFNQSGKQINELKTAITRLGHQLVQSAAMAFAVQQMKNEHSLRSIAKPLTELWKQSITVASICQVLARRTKVSPDEAFLTGLLHGIGRLYIMVRAVGEPDKLREDESMLDLISGWHPSIGKAVLENWGFEGDMAEAIGGQCEIERDRRRGREVDLSDVLIAGLMLGKFMETPAPRKIEVQGVPALLQSGCPHRIALRFSCMPSTSSARYKIRWVAEMPRLCEALPRVPLEIAPRSSKQLYPEIQGTEARAWLD